MIKLKVVFTLMALYCLLFTSSYAQTVLYHENFYETWQGFSEFSTNSSGWKVDSTYPSTYPQASGGNYYYSANIQCSRRICYYVNRIHTLTLQNNISTKGYDNIGISWGAESYGSNSVQLQYSTDGIIFRDIVTTYHNDEMPWAKVNSGKVIPLPAAAKGVDNLIIRWVISGAGEYSIDDVTLYGTPAEGLSIFKWSSRRIGEDPFTTSSPNSATPYVVDGVSFWFTESKAAETDLTQSEVTSDFQQTPSLTLNQKGATSTSGSTISFGFNKPLKDFSFTIFDTDRHKNQFQDIVGVTGYLDNVPVVSNKNKIITTRKNLFTKNKFWGSPDGTEATFTSSEGNVVYTFSGAIDRVEITYLNGDEMKGKQAIGISDMSWRKVEVGTLPVTLVSFKGAVNKGRVVLNWETASEIDNDYFEVQRSANGKDFTPVGQVKGSGNSTQLLKYGFVDPPTLSGVVYYRLKQVDYDGKFELTKVVAVHVLDSPKEQLVMYPNPTSSILNISLSNQQSSALEYSVFDLTGKQVKKGSLSSPNKTYVINVADLQNGSYLLKTVAGSSVQTAKFVKQ